MSASRLLGRCWISLAVILGPGPAVTGLSPAAAAAAPGASKPTLVVPDDPFFAEQRSAGEPRWAKFVLRVNDTRVYFQDSRRYPFHYDFVRRELDGYRDITLAEFERVTLHAANQELILGAVLLPPQGSPNELAVELVRLDPYTVDEIVASVSRVTTAIVAPPGTKSFYFPTPNQRASAETQRPTLLARGVEVSGVERWSLGDACYSPGWSLGALRFVPGDEIDAAYTEGRLGPQDLLLTDVVPAEIPYVAGVLSLLPATPSSHVAILAQDWGIPFAHVATPELRERAQELLGREIVVRAVASFGPCELRLDPVPDSVSTGERDALRALLKPRPLNPPPAAESGVYWLSAEDLTPADVRFVGGKAAHFGLLRDAVPDHSQTAIALTFDLWQRFLDQELAPGRSLRQEIAERLAPFAWPADLGEVRPALASIRDTIEDETTFAPALRAAVEQGLQPFDPVRRIRFRSSTNFEDTEGFTGAGLYDSESGCLADDLDDEERGPSRCDPGQAKERGVYRAIREVYASFYNDNAFLERLRRGVREQDLAMGLLVHHSYPDEFEMANGVLLVWTDCPCPVDITAQVGAVSVTNPEGGEVPEQTMVLGEPSLVRESSLLQRGSNVLAWPGEYQELERLARAVADAYAAITGGGGSYRLDIEWKKIVPGRLELKQVRRVPVAGARTDDLFVMDAPLRLCVQQAELGAVTGIHRLKSQLDLTTDSRFLDRDGLSTSSYGASRLRARFSAGPIELEGPPSSWPGAAFEVELLDEPAGERAILHDRFELAGGSRDQAPWSVDLVTGVPRTTSAPVVTSPDLFRLLDAHYPTPQLHLEPFAEAERTSDDTVLLGPCPDNWPDDPARRLRQERGASGPGGVEVRSTFDWPEPPSGPTAGYTAPAVGFVETTIDGLFGVPLRLRGYYSQTYHPAHHNFSEELLFEPARDEAVDPDAVRQLEAQNVRMLYVVLGGQSPRFGLIGSDGTVRSLPDTPVPRSLVARVVGERAVELRWQDASSGTTEFLVEHKSGDLFVPAARLPAGQTQVIIDQLALDVRHVFRVQARRAGIASLYSNEAALRLSSPGVCRDNAESLCLAERFEVSVHFRDQHHGGQPGTGKAVPATNTSGLFWFFEPANVELAVKVLDGRPINGKFWLFYGALTEVEYWVDVRDSATGDVRTYYNAPGNLCGRGDVDAFGAVAAQSVVDLRRDDGTLPLPRSGGLCEPSEARLCLQQRYAVEVSWRAHDGSTGVGQVITGLTTDRSGGFSFFGADNYELLVKLLDGRGVNGHHWLFFGALSDVAYELRLTDLATGTVRSYRNPAGTLCGQHDLEAF